MTDSPPDPPILNYATPGQSPRSRWSWEGWPLASGAAYAVFTFVWGIIVCRWILDPSTRAHVDFQITTWIFAIASMALGPLVLDRAKRHRRPTWLEIICFCISLSLLLTLFTYLIFGWAAPAPRRMPG